MKLRLFAFITLLCAGAAFADLGMYQDWDKGWVQHFLTKKEAKLFKKVATEKEAEEFVALFWARRDPSPGTPRNEFREEKERLAMHADEKYSTAHKAGSLTERGKVLLLLGTPFVTKEMVPTDSDGRLANEGVRSSETQAKWIRLTLDVWIYHKEQLERLPFKIQQNELKIEFKKEEGGKDFQLRTDVTASATLSALAKAVEGYIKSPDLATVPDWAKNMGMSPFKAKVDKLLAGEEPPASEKGLLTTAFFFDSTKAQYGCSMVFLPEESFGDLSPQVQFYMLLKDNSGKIIGPVDEAVTLAKTPGGLYVDRSFYASPGAHKLLMMLAKPDGQIFYSCLQDIEVPDLLSPDAESLWLVLSSDVRPLKEASYENSPFVFGGVKVVPKANGMFKTSEELWYFYNIFHPQMDPATSKPKMTQKVEFLKDGKRVRGTQATEPELTPLSEGRFAAGNSYNISQDLKLEPGSYTLKLTVKDTLSDKDFIKEIPFTIVVDEIKQP
jgi:GWxTD domain-containing protein